MSENQPEPPFITGKPAAFAFPPEPTDIDKIVDRICRGIRDRPGHESMEHAVRNIIEEAIQGNVFGEPQGALCPGSPSLAEATAALTERAKWIDACLCEAMDCGCWDRIMKRVTHPPT